MAEEWTDKTMNVTGGCVNTIDQKRPVSGTNEWAHKTENLQHGCRGRCKYCYACENALRFGRIEHRREWGDPALMRFYPNQVERRSYPFRQGQTIMFPSAHDIEPNNVNECLDFLELMLGAGNRVLIVSKPDPGCINILIQNLGRFKEQVEFRFSIGTLDDDLRRWWEPGAPSVDDRLESINLVWADGWKVSVSCEPFFDPHIPKIVPLLQDRVDSIWFGKMNRINTRVGIGNLAPDDYQKYVVPLFGIYSKSWIVNRLYEPFKDNPKVKWKDSIKKVLDLDRPMEAGLDR